MLSGCFKRRIAQGDASRYQYDTSRHNNLIGTPSFSSSRACPQASYHLPSIFVFELLVGIPTGISFRQQRLTFQGSVTRSFIPFDLGVINRKGRTRSHSSQLIRSIARVQQDKKKEESRSISDGHSVFIFLLSTTRWKEFLFPSRDMTLDGNLFWKRIDGAPFLQ